MVMASPLVAAAEEVGSRQALLERAPFGETPGLDLEVLHLLAEVGHVLCGERLGWRESERARSVSGVRQRPLSEAQGDEAGLNGSLVQADDGPKPGG